MWDLFREFNQDRRINHLQDRIDGIRVGAKFNARDAAYEVTNELNTRVNKLLLMNMAMMELLIEKTDISEQDIKSKITEIDLRDGTKDGKYDAKAAAPPAKDCPKCDAKISRDFNRCLFCGYQDQEAQSNVW